MCGAYEIIIWVKDKSIEKLDFGRRQFTQCYDFRADQAPNKITASESRPLLIPAGGLTTKETSDEFRAGSENWTTS